MIWAVTVYLGMLAIEQASKRAYRRGCRDGIRRGRNRGYRNAMADNADLLSEAEFIIEQLDKEDSMWAHHIQQCGKQPGWDPWYRSDN